ncbi:hypothetical protein MPTK1_7g17000 [Marchantia polymorpha subsp. ruderalis]|uniref:RNA-binding S4 domain-containing protein n=2 Tax=Marchantia polymorpha TaxID=3197 RepID=A0AAF6C0M4_MARPO|nr:hypothetical protein MARPO_0051s0038 [Marchantia polymorpha]BBN17808.1 hypothetical protein Mp_7g17000 [Marchantia polymorpha subsp. ruderalis]|eukprot:PTQ38434.1 hypothetical protein MARPO_0051s0038 [Marchantia polymorpha]
MSAVVLAHSALAYTRCLVLQPIRKLPVAHRSPCSLKPLRVLQPGRCYAAVLSREDRNHLLSGVDPSNIDAVTRILEQGKNAADRWEIAYSSFLTPPTLHDALLALKRVADIGIVVWGGYSEAERCRLALGNIEAMNNSVREEIEAAAVSAVSISGNFKYDKVSHGDFLGAVLGTGIVREKVGDIIVKGDQGAQVLVVPELAGFLCAAVTQVRVVPVETSPIPLSDLEVIIPKKDVMKTVEASLRVDAIASAGFKMSRSKLQDTISGGALFINWKEVNKGGATLKTGDVVSLRGKGRIEIGEINVTKKGRYAVEIMRYL